MEPGIDSDVVDLTGKPNPDRDRKGESRKRGPPSSPTRRGGQVTPNKKCRRSTRYKTPKGDKNMYMGGSGSETELEDAKDQEEAAENHDGIA